VGNVSHLDGEWADDDSSYTYPLDHLTVVDRDPVEWPEGWRAADGWRDMPVPVARFEGRYVSLLTKADVERILATGPDMLARWDELVGGDA